jgi:hypothetical protein
MDLLPHWLLPHDRFACGSDLQFGLIDLQSAFSPLLCNAPLLAVLKPLRPHLLVSRLYHFFSLFRDGITILNYHLLE